MLDFGSLFYLSTYGPPRFLHVAPREQVLNSFEITRGEHRPEKPIVFDYMNGISGDVVGDFIGTALVDPMLISERVVRILASFRGWTTCPVEVYGKGNVPIVGYSGLIVTGRCGEIDNSRSQVRVFPPKTPLAKPYRAWVGLYFDERSWDGSDLFVPPGMTRIFMVQAVKDALEAASVTNVRFVKLAEFERTATEMGIPVGEAGGPRGG